MVLEAKEVETLLDQAGRYPFLEALRPLATRLTELGKRDHAYVLKHLPSWSWRTRIVTAFSGIPNRLAMQSLRPLS
jgi:hypothetical protein